MKKFSLTTLILTFHTVCGAGPLGLDMGMPLTQLQSKIKLKSDGPHQFSTPTLPDGHPDFDDYRLVVTPQHGLCKLTAWTPTIRTSVYGTELQSAFDRYFNALSSKYGVAKKFDYLRSGSIWDEGRDWMMALLKKERSLIAFWTEKELTLPDNLSAIKLQAYANGTEAGMVSISYEFKNASNCIDWIQANKDSKL